jgi:activator of HSP90 ATPase
MVLHNPNNWHWVNKDVSPWAKEFLESQIVGISAKEEEVSAKVTKLVSMDGDVEVSQRKGKLMSIFDVALNMEYEGIHHAFYRQSHQLRRKQVKTKKVQMSVAAYEFLNAPTTQSSTSTSYVPPSTNIEGQPRTC